jgi:competence protein ComEC
VTREAPARPTGGAAARPVDARLAVAVAPAWVVLAACRGAGAGYLVALAVVAAAIGCAGLLLRRRPACRLIAAAGFCTAVVLIPFAARSWSARASPLHRLAGAHAAVTIDLVTTEDPHPLAATGVAGMPRVAVQTDAVAVDTGSGVLTLAGPVLVLAPARGWQDVLPGQHVRMTGTVQPSLDGGTAGATLFAEQPPELLGRPPWWQRAAGSVRSGLRDAAGVLPAAERGLLPGLVDGDTAGLDPVLVERFRVAGLTHLVAVSGTNCSIVVGIVLLVLQQARVRPWPRALAGGAVLVAFVMVARPSPSVLRAAVMAVIALVSLATGRPRAALPALAAAVLALLIWDPRLCVDAGFTMSVLATGALLVLAPGWAATLRRWRVPMGVAEAIAVASAAHVVTAPVIAALSGRVSLVAVPANVLAEPAVPVATVFGFGAAVVDPLWSPGARALAWLAGWPCRWLVGVAERMGAVPGASLPWTGGGSGALTLLAVIVALLWLARRAGVWRWLAVSAVLGVLVQIPVRAVLSGWPPPGWVFVACDVGQGDALVLDAGPHTAVTIDAGPDPIAVDRCLRELGVTDIAVLAITHFHLDHVGGIVGLLHGRRVGRVVSGPLPDPLTGVSIVQRALAPLRLGVVSPPVGATFDVGRVHLEVLGPAAPFHDTRSDPNNSSLVLRATIGDVRILLPGDLEVEAQQAMLAAGTDVRADVLKVPHHGSAYSDPAFLAAVRPRVGVISVGLHNDYGHPSPVLLRELATLGVPVRRTDHDGDVAVVGPRARLTTVLHAVSSVAGGTPRVGAGPGERGGVAASAPGVRMGAWQPAPSRSTTCPIRSRHSCCSSATRNCWSPGASARSPPPRAGVTRT